MKNKLTIKFIFITALILFLPVKTLCIINQGYVSDNTGTLSIKEKNLLNRISQQLYQKTNSQIVTVVVNSIGNETIDEYSNKLFEKWGIGDKKNNMGVLFIIALKEKKTRIEVGYGLEGLIPDGRAGAVLDKNVLPYFKQGQFIDGIVNGHLTIAGIIAKHYKVPLSLNSHQPTASKPTSNFPSAIIKIILLILFFSVFRGSRLGLLGLLLLSGSGRSYSSSFSNFGGSGFGGFGGGLSGGGGASRGW
ncbi:MAG: TPM domain-containing protein [bacterium]|nr:TPM domain-containing protein [bacterium]